MRKLYDRMRISGDEYEIQNTKLSKLSQPLNNYTVKQLHN